MHRYNELNLLLEMRGDVYIVLTTNIFYRFTSTLQMFLFNLALYCTVEV